VLYRVKFLGRDFLWVAKVGAGLEESIARMSGPVEADYVPGDLSHSLLFLD